MHYGYVVLIPVDRKYKPSNEFVQKIKTILEELGIIAEGYDNIGKRKALVPGPNYHHFILSNISPYTGDWKEITIMVFDSQPNFVCDYSQNLKAQCPHCKKDIEHIEQLVEIAPRSEQWIYKCPACDKKTDMNNLSYSPDAGFGYFQIRFSNVNSKNIDLSIIKKIETKINCQIKIIYGNYSK